MRNIQIDNLFKNEIKYSGQQEFEKKTIFISNSSDTHIQATVKSMIPIKISFRTLNITESHFTAVCSCTVYKNGHLCKHIWALLLTVEQKHPDFLTEKNHIDIISYSETAEGIIENKKKEDVKEYKKKQNKFIREKNKENNKSSQIEKKITYLGKFGTKELSVEVKSAISYFALNGFEMNNPIDEDFLNKAKKTLSRVFHPDRGGSHDEVTELNNNYEIILEFIRGT